MTARYLPVLTAGLVLLFGALGFAADSGGLRADVTATRIPLYPANPAERRAGALTYRGGLVLSLGAGTVGGWSDVAVSADGGEILSVSDDGYWLRAHLSYDPAGDLAGLNSAEIAPMLDMTGRRLRGKEGDAEGLALERPNDLHGPVAVSFERDVRVWRYDLSQGLSARPTDIPIGDWVKSLHYNQQLEAITLIKPDTLLAFAEAKVGARDDILAAMEAYPNTGRPPATRMLSVVPHDPFSVTSVANAPDGGLYLLERRFSFLGGLGMEVRHIAPSEIREGARLNGEVLANLSFQDANIDNMEGLAVRRGPEGRDLPLHHLGRQRLAAAAHAASDVRGEERRLRACHAAGAASVFACFLTIWRFRRSALVDRPSLRALSRNTSNPPLRSMVRSAFMLIFSDTFWPSVSLARLTVWRLGRNTRFLRLLAWLTRCPLRTPFPVNSQRRAMASSFLRLGIRGAVLLRKAQLPVKRVTWPPFRRAGLKIEFAGPV